MDSSGSGKWDEVVAPRLAVGYLIVAVGTWRRISWRIPLGMLVTLSGWLRGLLLS